MSLEKITSGGLAGAKAADKTAAIAELDAIIAGLDRDEGKELAVEIARLRAIEKMTPGEKNLLIGHAQRLKVLLTA
ncbi:hypothetical protein LCGC14_0552540 [marine sediment metagenome]|uniref:Uncharacterized protein n=1 Tax=marine sediment metagenome TaxID=412755 RepID=A0A0F9UAY9_9ZZZZ